MLGNMGREFIDPPPGTNKPWNYQSECTIGDPFTVVTLTSPMPRRQ
jgi:hypothetical protein